MLPVKRTSSLLVLSALLGCSTTPNQPILPIMEPLDIPNELTGHINRPYVLWYDMYSETGAMVCVTEPNARDLRDYIIKLETRVDGWTAFGDKASNRNRL